LQDRDAGSSTALAEDAGLCQVLDLAGRLALTVEIRGARALDFLGGRLDTAGLDLVSKEVAM
jgi:hypothetical protein